MNPRPTPFVSQAPHSPCIEFHQLLRASYSVCVKQASRAGSPERANSPPPPASPTHQLSPAVKHKTAPPSYHIEPVLGKRGTQLTSTIPLSPVNLKTGKS